MMFRGRDPAYTTAYDSSYTYDSSLVRPTERFRHLPSSELKHSTNFITKQNLHVPKCPHRHIVTDRIVEHGVITTLQLSVAKPIVRSPRPQDFNREMRAFVEERESTLVRAEKTNKLSPFDEEINRQSIRRRWTSKTREATEECALPTPTYPAPETTLEPCPDPVLHRAQKYNSKPCIWQQYAREWDMMQLRKPMPPLANQRNPINLPEIPSNNSMVVKKPPQHQNNFVKRLADCSGTGVAHHMTMAAEQQYARPMPGYGGFVPRNAVEPRLVTSRDYIEDSMCSTSRRAYRRFPTEEYRRLQFARNGPLSKTITLTYPHNPFSKPE